jgi:hypothetical protein
MSQESHGQSVCGPDPRQCARKLDGVYSSELLAHQRVAELKREGKIASIVDIALNQKGGRA